MHVLQEEVKVNMSETVAEWKAFQLARLLDLQSYLLKAKPELELRIKWLVELLIIKLENVRSISTLYEYLKTLYMASTEFPEFRDIMPTTQSVEKLIQALLKGSW
jgi:hypothetical protein